MTIRAAFAFAFIALFAAGPARSQPASPELSLHFLDVAQGDATLVT